MQIGKTTFLIRNNERRRCERRWLATEQPLPLNEVFCFSGQVYFSHQRKRLTCKPSVEAADFISLFIIHHSYGLYFRRSNPSYSPATDTFLLICAAMCDVIWEVSLLCMKGK